MAVTVTRETHPRVTLKGANSGTVNSGILVGSGDGNRVSMTFTATAEPIIVIPEGPVSDAQLEAGAFETSYIPNTADSGTVTRSADIASIPVSAFGYNQTAGTVVVEYTLDAEVLSSNNYVAQLDDGSSSNRVLLQASSSGQSRIFMSAAGVTQDSFGSEAVLDGVANKVAAAFVENSTGVSTNGAATENGDGTSSVPSGITTLRLGLHFNGNFPLNGHLKSLKYYPRRLTDAQLQELTA